MNVIKEFHNCGINFIYVDNVEGLPHITYPEHVDGGYTFQKPDLSKVVDTFIDICIDKDKNGMEDLFENQPIYFQRNNISRGTHKFNYVRMTGIKRFLYKYFLYIFDDLKDIKRNGYHKGFYQFFKEFK